MVWASWGEPRGFLKRKRKIAQKFIRVSRTSDSKITPGKPNTCRAFLYLVNRSYLSCILGTKAAGLITRRLFLQPAWTPAIRHFFQHPPGQFRGLPGCGAFRWGFPFVDVFFRCAARPRGLFRGHPQFMPGVFEILRGFYDGFRHCVAQSSWPGLKYQACLQ